MKAWQNRQQFDGCNFRAWIFRIARNVIADEARKRRPISLSEESSLVDKQEMSGLEGMLDQERNAVVQDCMKTLSEQEAAVVKRRTLGLSYEEIAQALNVSVSRAHTLHHQGKNKLKSCVERKLP